MPNAVGLMGTALTAEQLGELARMASKVLLALDADAAGQEAMMRAARMASARKLELRVVELPGGADPAELVREQGAGALAEAIAQAVPLVRFQVQRALAGADVSTPEGRDRALEALGPIFATIPPSAMRMELTRLVSGALDLPESLAEQLLGQSSRSAPRSGSGAGARAHGAGNGPGGQRERPDTTREPGAGDDRGHSRARAQAEHTISRRMQTERTFLALCIASPALGEQALKELDIDDHFTSEPMRRAAAHLRDGDLRDPLAGMEHDDPELSTQLAQLVVAAGNEPADGVVFEVQRLQLELALLDRQIRGARARDDGRVSELAHRRATLKREFDTAQEQALEQTGAA
jgi:DNA primase